MESIKGTFSCQCCYEPYETVYRLNPTDGGIDLCDNFCESCDDLYCNDYDAWVIKNEEGIRKQKLIRRSRRIKNVLDNKN